jgi:hypothetical protein
MQKKVKFRAKQEQTAGDHNGLQGFVQETLDHMVRDTITETRKFAGFQVTSLDGTNVRIAPGRLFDNGAVFGSDENADRNLFDYLPLAAKKIVTITAVGQVDEKDVQPRQFLVDVVTRATQPQSVAMQEARVANIGLAPGVESADPQRAPIAAQFLAIADIVLNTTGIEEIRMITSNRVPKLVDVDRRTRDLETFQAAAEPRIQTIGSDIAALNNRLRGSASTRAIIEMASDIARLKDVVGLPDDYASYAADFYLTANETDVENVDLLAKVEEGIRFSPAAAQETQISVYNPLDTAQVVRNGILLPAFTSLPRISVDQYAGELRLQQYTFQTTTFVQKTMSRQRIRYGQQYSVCTNNRAWWVGGNYDPTTNTFRKNGETFIVENPEELRGAHSWIRLTQYWVDTFEDPYWDVLTTTNSVNGQSIAQTFLNSQDGWLTGIRIGLTRLAGSGSITLALCETYRGAPDVGNAIAQVTVNRGDLKTYPQEGTTLFPLPPTFLSAGKRYAIVLVTAADHYAAVATGGQYAQGTLFYSTDGAWFDGDFTRDLVFAVEFARFERVRTVVELAPLSLSGGIASLDILAGMVVPRSCQCFFEVQAPGGGWETIDSITAAKLVGLPPLLQFRAVMIGTTDVAPGIQVSGSRVTLERPRDTFKHITTARVLPAPTSQVKVTVRLENWNPARHTHSMRLLCGSSFATIETADVVDTSPTEDPKAIIREYTFNTAAPVSTYKIEQTGATTTALDTYLVSSRVDVTF